WLAGIPHARVVAGALSPRLRGSRYVTQRVASVLVGGRVLGEVVISVPLNPAVLERLERRAGLSGGDRLVLLNRGRIAVGPARLVGTPLAPGGRASPARVGQARHHTP